MVIHKVSIDCNISRLLRRLEVRQREKERRDKEKRRRREGKQEGFVKKGKGEDR